MSLYLTLGTNLAKRAVSYKILQPCASFHGRSKIGNREVVGFGMNGSYSYTERPDYPMPAIRFREDTAEVKKLREKEKDDWKKLTLDEKKTLYRSSFRQTFAEFKAPDGDWKFVVGGLFTFVSLMLWSYMFMKKFVYPEMPKSMTPEHQQKMLKVMLELGVDRIDGLSTEYYRQLAAKNWKD